MKRWLTQIELGRKTAHLVAFVAGALYALAFAPFYIWPVILISFPILYGLLIKSISRAQALWRGFFFGYGFFMAGTWWIGNALLVDAAKFGWMLPFSILGLSAVMALWMLPLAYLIHRLRRLMTPLLFAALWVVVEYARGWGMFGFPWNLAGYISLSHVVMAQGAALVGVYGLSFAVVWLALLPVYYHFSLRKGVAASLIALVLLGVVFVKGADRLHPISLPTNVTLRLVQPNVPQEVKGTREGAEVAAESLGRLTGLPSATPPDIILWPETAYPFNIRIGGPVMVPGFKGTLLTGAVRAEGYAPDIRIWNSVFALSTSGDVLGYYDKHQLVPFGEFVPLRSVLPLDKITPGDLDFSRGAGPATLRVKNLPPFSPLICYEGIFPAIAVNTADRPAWLLNVTNDAWYGVSPGPYQHFDMVRMRAIEQGLPLVRVANSGISAVIDPRGRVVASLGLFTQGVIDQRLPAALPPTLYAKYQGKVLLIIILLAILSVALARILQRQRIK